MNFNILEFNGEADHVHALIEYPPKLSISQIVNSLLRRLKSSLWAGWLQKTPQGLLVES
jgi:REP element-mobilizing transposase RayT